jgi:tRNA pseudouridine55 synthase
LLLLFGLLILDKPPGQTSRWVVDQVQRLVRPAKVGHAGTLDPLATGVLIVCVGPATRLIDYIHQLPKQYRAEFLFGRASSTEDITGEVSELSDPPQPTRDKIESALRKFTGEIQQRPPAFSALKVAGQRAYKLARQGKEVALAPRPVSIHNLKLIEYSYPTLTLDVTCSTGTYIRSLGRDVAESLGTAAVMSALVRTAIGSFPLADAIDPLKLTRDNIINHLLPPLRAVDHLPMVVLSPDDRRRIASGQFIDCPVQNDSQEMPREFAALDDCGNLIAIVERRPNGQLGPALNLQQE